MYKSPFIEPQSKFHAFLQSLSQEQLADELFKIAALDDKKSANKLMFGEQFINWRPSDNEKQANLAQEFQKHIATLPDAVLKPHWEVYSNTGDISYYRGDAFETPESPPKYGGEDENNWGELFAAANVIVFLMNNLDAINTLLVQGIRNSENSENLTPPLGSENGNEGLSQD